MRIKLLIIIFCTFNNYLFSQPSYSTSLAFRLFDIKNEFVDMDKFRSEYKIASTFGHIIEPIYLEDFLYYDSDMNYFCFKISTIGPRFSFAIYHKDKIMTVFIPFTRDKKSRYQYALDIKVIEGDYLLNFFVKNKKK